MEKSRRQFIKLAGTGMLAAGATSIYLPSGERPKKSFDPPEPAFRFGAPYTLRGTTWEQEREPYTERLLDVIEEYCPNIRSIVVERQTLSPYDLEQRFGITGGNIFHGEMSLDQMFALRPLAGWARYRTPVKGLYLCGSGAHPGGGVMGAPGHNAAREILKDR